MDDFTWYRRFLNDMRRFGVKKVSYSASPYSPGPTNYYRLPRGGKYSWMDVLFFKASNLTPEVIEGFVEYMRREYPDRIRGGYKVDEPVYIEDVQVSS